MPEQLVDDLLAQGWGAGRAVGPVVDNLGREERLVDRVCDEDLAELVLVRLQPEDGATYNQGPERFVFRSTTRDLPSTSMKASAVPA
jgi:hypothetical protein